MRRAGSVIGRLAGHRQAFFDELLQLRIQSGLAKRYPQTPTTFARILFGGLVSTVSSAAMPPRTFGGVMGWIHVIIILQRWVTSWIAPGSFFRAASVASSFSNRKPIGVQPSECLNDFAPEQFSSASMSVPGFTRTMSSLDALRLGSERGICTSAPLSWRCSWTCGNT